MTIAKRNVGIGSPCIYAPKSGRKYENESPPVAQCAHVCLRMHVVFLLLMLAGNDVMRNLPDNLSILKACLNARTKSFRTLYAEKSIDSLAPQLGPSKLPPPTHPVADS